MGILSVAVRKARTVATFSGFELLLIVPVFLLLGVARLAVLTLPFHSYAGLFGGQVGFDVVPPDLPAAKASRAERIGRVIHGTAKLTPWASLCLPQAMVAALLLRLIRTPYCAYFGLAPKAEISPSGPLAAHCWIRAGNSNITGGQRVARYTVVKVFDYRSGLTV